MGAGTFPAVLIVAFFFLGPVSVLVPLIKINKETTKIFKRFLKRGEKKF